MKFVLHLTQNRVGNAASGRQEIMMVIMRLNKSLSIIPLAAASRRTLTTSNKIITTATQSRIPRILPTIALVESPLPEMNINSGLDAGCNEQMNHFIT